MRLIDADALYMRYSVNVNGQRIPEKDCDNFPIMLSIAEVKQIIRESTTIDPVKRGECEFCINDYFDYIVCYLPTNNGNATSVPVNFCPHCGADMRTEGQHE